MVVIAFRFWATVLIDMAKYSEHFISRPDYKLCPGGETYWPLDFGFTGFYGDGKEQLTIAVRA